MGIIQKFPSYDYIINNAVFSIKRFPLTILSALVATICFIWMAEYDIDPGRNFPSKLVLIAMLGLPLFTALALFAEKRNWSKVNSLIIQTAGFIFLVIYFFTLPEKIGDIDYHIVRILLFAITFHFMTAFLPFITSDEEHGFWQYNKSLFLRFLTSALFSGVLYLGLALALAAIEHLFGLNIEHQRYIQLWVVIGILINTFIFLSGIPDDLNKLESDSSYPKGLKVFAQYILLPLVMVYFLILIVYEAKIIFTWDWPKGWVAQLVLWYSVIGILSLLLLYPLRKISENIWIQRYSKQFFYALIPLLFMLYFAILKRINEYGITENRYYVFAMAIGLTFVVFYFIFSTKKQIKVIPLTICILAFLSAVGPFSSFSIAQTDQINRLISFFNKYEMLQDDSIVQPSSSIIFEDRKEMSSIVNHLKSMYGMEPFAQWISDTEFVKFDTTRYINISDLTKSLHFTYTDYWETEERGTPFRYQAVPNNLMPITDKKYFLNFEYQSYLFDSTIVINETYRFFNDTFLISFNTNNNNLTIYRDLDNDTSKSKIEFDIEKKLENLLESPDSINVPSYKLTIYYMNEYFSMDFLIRNVEGNIRHDSVFITNLSIFASIKQ